MPAPNLSRAAFSQGSQVCRVRRATGAYVAGRWTPAVDEDVLIRMAVRPNSFSKTSSPFSMRVDLPEGMRTDDTITALVMPSTPLRVESSVDDGGVAPDRILYRGYWWKVVGETEWDQVGFRRYIALREQKWGED